MSDELSGEKAIKICKAAAKALAGKDWHRMNRAERELADNLAQEGYLTKPFPANGFIGKAVFQ
jgi:hypothetical protein